MELRHLQCFVAVADEGSFVKAAERLCVATSNVSQQLRQLERELGVRLFDRTTRRVELTPEGGLLLRSAEDVLARVEILREAAREAAGGRAGVIRAARVHGAGDMVSELVRAFEDRCPGVVVDFRTRQTAEVTEEVLAGEVRLGIARTTAAGLDSIVLNAHPSSCLVVRKDHPLAAQREVRLQALHGQPYVLIDRGANAYFHDAIVEFFHSRGIEPAFRTFFIRTVEEAVERVAEGHGVALMSRTMAERYPRRGTTIVRVAGPAPIEEHFLMWRRDDTSPVIAALVQAARDILPTLQQL